MKLEVVINALAYELGLFFAERYPSIKFQLWFQNLMEHCRPYWVTWKTKQTMADVDHQTEILQKQWAEEDTKTQQPIYTESAPDGSKAQDLLGGEMRLTAPWYDKDQPKT